METGESRQLLNQHEQADPAWLERLRRELNAAQFRFATAGDDVILGLAGPGSGKTRALVYRAAHPVSYTHLDVYKRQTLCIPFSSWKSRSSLSYTLLLNHWHSIDVYKRQDQFRRKTDESFLEGNSTDRISNVL